MRERLQLLFIQRGLKLESGYYSCIFTCAMYKCIVVVMSQEKFQTCQRQRASDGDEVQSTISCTHQPTPGEGGKERNEGMAPEVV